MEIKALELKCYDCNKIITLEDLHEVYDDDNDKQVVCKECFGIYMKCDNCGDYHKHLNTAYQGNRNSSDEVCDECLSDNYTHCPQCNFYYSEDVEEDNNGDYYCYECRGNGYGSFDDEDDDSFKELKADIDNTKHQSKEEGDIIKSQRGFSTEIECYYDDIEATNTVYDEIEEKLTGTGISGDGSLGLRGIEYQTPILKGKKGEEYIKSFTKLLNDNDYKTNTTCGLHIHLDGSDFFTIRNKDYYTESYDDLMSMIKERGEDKQLITDLQTCYYELFYSDSDILKVKKARKDLDDKLIKLGYLKEGSSLKDNYNSPKIVLLASDTRTKKLQEINTKKLKRLFIMYYYLENTISQFLPNSRRQSDYCKPIDDSYAISDIMECRDITTFENTWYKSTDQRYINESKRNHYHNTRYNGFNFHCLLSQKHFEVRHHSGTINPTKILYWTYLHQTILDKAVDLDNDIQDYRLKFIRRSINLEDKRMALYEYLQLDKKAIEYFESRAKIFIEGKKKNNEEDKMETLQEVATPIATITTTN